jgi:hypothetical protein
LPEKTAAAGPEMTTPADLIRGFAALSTPADGNDAKLTEWISAARAVALPHLHSFTSSLELHRSAVNAGLTSPYPNGRTEGVNTHTKSITRSRCTDAPDSTFFAPDPPALTATRRYHRLRAKPDNLDKLTTGPASRSGRAGRTVRTLGLARRSVADHTEIAYYVCTVQQSPD